MKGTDSVILRVCLYGGSSVNIQCDRQWALEHMLQYHTGDWGAKPRIIGFWNDSNMRSMRLCFLSSAVVALELFETENKNASRDSDSAFRERYVAALEETNRIARKQMRQGNEWKTEDE